MPKVLITTIPFADKNNLPLELLKSVGADVLINPIGRKLKEEELAELIEDLWYTYSGNRANNVKSVR